ncbi:LOW QUALITY PROTEIN: hypothetical protein Dda_0417 [Drechslerella dactyloides]|uniref:PWI domain-containing protein n=1 Tax=Drechslerella dactyloides TaxID=74499 RepID=A0AAD6J4F0_DREDA|nr:LOW QUALITY PROTEIN: hypothetical protein Dda_0417 [Drechslerella dactyloides]
MTPTLTEKWYGDSNKLVAALFSLARKLEPSIIFIDEIDAVLRSRSSADHEASTMVKAEFMTHWDGLLSTVDQKPPRIVVLGATNRIQDIDEAILRRLPKRFAVSLPNTEQRTRILKIILKDTKLDGTGGFDLDELVKRTAGMSGSDMKEACRDAAMIPIREYIKDKKAKGEALLCVKPEENFCIPASREIKFSVHILLSCMKAPARSPPRTATLRPAVEFILGGSLVPADKGGIDADDNRYESEPVVGELETQAAEVEFADDSAKMLWRVVHEVDIRARMWSRPGLALRPVEERSIARRSGRNSFRRGKAMLISPQASCADKAGFFSSSMGRAPTSAGIDYTPSTRQVPITQHVSLQPSHPEKTRNFVGLSLTVTNAKEHTHGYGRPPVQMSPGMPLPPGFGFPPGVNPGGPVPQNFAAPGVAPIPGIAPHTAQASLPNRPGVPAFSPPASLPNINFNAPIIRLGTASTKQLAAPTTSSHSQPTASAHQNQSSKSSTAQNPGSSLSREPASAFIPPTVDEQIKSVFVGSLPPLFPDEWIERILKVAAGPVRRWIRVSDEGGKPRNFGFCEYETFEGVSAATTAIHGLKISHPGENEKTSTISVVHDDRAGEFVDKIREHGTADSQSDGSSSVGLSSRYESVRLAISGIVSEYADPDRQADAKSQNKAPITDRNSAPPDEDTGKSDEDQPEVVTISLTVDDELADIPADMRETVSKEIAAFRERSNKRDIERIKREEEIEQQERDRLSGSRSYRFSSPPASAPTGPSAGPNSIPVGPSRLRNDLPPSTPTGPAAQSVKFVNGSTSSRLPQEDDDSDASDSELEYRRKHKKSREADALFLDHERRWLNRERSRTSAIEREATRDREDVKREDMERGAMNQRLSEWDDDIEMERRVEDYYIDHSLWIRNRVQFRSREKDMDARDRALEERLLDNEKKSSENANPQESREKAPNQDTRFAGKEAQQPRIKLSLGASARNKATDITRPRRTVADIEGLLEDEEEDTSKARRVLIPIQYEETVGADDESREELVKALAAEIPSDRNGLWTWTVNWDFVDDAMIKEKLQPFVEKKIVEYLGVQEQELITFVLEHIKKRGSAADLVKELEMALDEDAEVLVKKIWRMLIFFSEGEKRGLVS